MQIHIFRSICEMFRFGAVYRGTFRGQDVAIKKMHPHLGPNNATAIAELQKEVQALKTLSHPRLLPFVGACLTPPNFVIVTMFMPNGSLNDLLHIKKTQLERSEQYRLASEICEGVAYLHSLTPPVVHRDLKTMNIVLDKNNGAKICDFGLTVSMDSTHISRAGSEGGSPRYMAPELFDTAQKITEKVYLLFFCFR